MRELCSSELRAVQFECPYNSFGKLLLAEGYDVPDVLGGNCVLQNQELTARLLANAVDPSKITYTTAKERPHWVSFVDDGEGLLFMDPFILQQEPIDVAPLLSGDVQEIEAALYPNLEVGSSLAEIRLLGTGEMQVILKAIRRSGSRRRFLTYTYDLTDLGDSLPGSSYQRFAGLRQKHLEFAVLFPDTTVRRLYMNPDNGEMTLVNVGYSKLPRRHQPAAFDRGFRELADHLSVEFSDLHQYFIEARAVYCDMRDRGALNEPVL